MRVLDLGCGIGRNLTSFIDRDDQVIGLDISHNALKKAVVRFPQRLFCLASGEAVPLQANTIDKVVSNVALPYMRMPITLGEVRRVLRPGGYFIASLHPWTFTVHELLTGAFPNPKATLYRLYVIVNGLLLHLFSRSFGESFQTKRGIGRALKKSGFSDVQFFYAGQDKRWFVKASANHSSAEFSSPVTDSEVKEPYSLSA